MRLRCRHPLERNRMQITSLDIELTQLCNLNCPYCYLGRERAKGTITEAILSSCFQLLDKFSKPPVLINFYGGEPLLAFDKIRFFVEESKRLNKPYKFAAVSNGTIADPEIIAYCKANKIGVQRSLDGCPEAMALCRGEGTLEKYNKATPFWMDYKKGRRTTVIPETAKYLLEDLLYFRKLGFPSGFTPMPDFYAKWEPQHVEDFKSSLWKLGEEFVKEFREWGSAFYCFWFSRDVRRFECGPKPVPVSQGCGAGRGLWSLSWDGYMFLCHRFTTEDKNGPFCYGRIDEIIEGTAKGYGEIVQQGLEDANNKKRPMRCSACIGQYGCNVCCYHSNFKCTGSMIEPPQLFCELKRESAKVMQWIDNELREQYPNWWKTIRKGGGGRRRQGKGQQPQPQEKSEDCCHACDLESPQERPQEKGQMPQGKGFAKGQRFAKGRRPQGKGFAKGQRPQGKGQQGPDDWCHVCDFDPSSARAKGQMTQRQRCNGQCQRQNRQNGRRQGCSCDQLG